MVGVANLSLFPYPPWGIRRGMLAELRPGFSCCPSKKLCVALRNAPPTNPFPLQPGSLMVKRLFYWSRGDVGSIPIRAALSLTGEQHG